MNKANLSKGFVFICNILWKCMVLSRKNIDIDLTCGNLLIFSGSFPWRQEKHQEVVKLSEAKPPNMNDVFSCTIKHFRN